MSSSLKTEELSALRTLARDRALDARQALFERVAELLLEADGNMTGPEQHLMDEILGDLIRQVETSVRAELADRVADMRQAPPGLLRMLANDDIEVAKPVLMRSNGLGDEDLIAIVDERTPGHRLVISGRPELAEEVCDAIVRATPADNDHEIIVLETLLDNPGANIAQTTYAELVSRSQSQPRLRSPLLKRQDMSPVLAHRMFWFVSGVLRQHIVENFAVDPEMIDQVLEDAAEAGIARFDSDDHMKLAADLAIKSARRRIPDLIAELRQNEIGGFANGFGELLGVPREVARRILADKDGEALAIACRAAGADRGQFTTIFLLLDYKRFGAARPTGHLEQISRLFDRVSEGRARSCVTLWGADEAVRLAA